MQVSIFVVGLVMVVIGITGLSSAARKKASRRKIAGIEAFAGYGKLMVKRNREAHIELASGVLTIAGSVMAIAAYLTL